MGFLSTLLGGGDAIKSIGDTVDKLFTSDLEKLEAQNEKYKAEREFNFKESQLLSQQNLAQTEVNKVEAASTNWFVSGWRPAVGWTCCASLSYVTVIEPLLRFTAQVLFGYTGSFPQIDTSITTTILIGMLGLGTIRMNEKIKGVESK